MLHVAGEGISFQADWPYAIHLLAHIYASDINSVRFLWKLMPAAVKESQPEVVAAWIIRQNLWTRNYAGVYEAIRSFNWNPEAQAIVSSFAGPVSIVRDHDIKQKLVEQNIDVKIYNGDLLFHKKFSVLSWSRYNDNSGNATFQILQYVATKP